MTAEFAPPVVALPDGTRLVVAVATAFRSGSVLVWTPWGAFDGETLAEATERAVAAYPAPSEAAA